MHFKAVLLYTEGKDWKEVEMEVVPLLYMNSIDMLRVLLKKVEGVKKWH